MQKTKTPNKFKKISPDNEGDWQYFMPRCLVFRCIDDCYSFSIYHHWIGQTPIVRERKASSSGYPPPPTQTCLFRAISVTGDVQNRLLDCFNQGLVRPAMNFTWLPKETDCPITSNHWLQSIYHLPPLTNSQWLYDDRLYPPPPRTTDLYFLV